MKFRHKPVVIEAIQYINQKSLDDMDVAWGDSFTEKVFDEDDRYFFIETLSGDHKASFGDWIIKGIAGEFYPCKDEIFKLSYERVEE